eukprot:TRINITY_DN2029_c0_g1_i3.p1 TRINITY_DN2029_c0_g1~~TRINITY_DN2029_c0_g1_i3.p1  ORF type:complete len:401 (-),score=65.88 TRINITY_DN2029_c0_g1_i3:402-1604(-)
MIGFMITNPIFAHFSHTYRPTYLMCVGLSLWSFATIASAIAPNFYFLAFCRMVTGAGEASFAGLAPTYIHDNAPTESRTKWLSLFYAAIPVGGAFGYAISGIISQYWDWYAVFYLEGILMLPLAILCVYMPINLDDDNSADQVGEDGLEDSAESSKLLPQDTPQVDTSIRGSLEGLANSPVYLLCVFGYAAYTFVIGAFAFWCPSYLEERFDLDKTTSNSVFGSITALAGLFGTSFGGWFLDRALKSLPSGARDDPSVGLKVSMVAVLIALPISVAVFYAPDAAMFFLAMGFAEFLMFSVTGPINGAILSSVPAHLRSFGMGSSNMLIHLFGDLPSPIIVGALSDSTGDKSLSLAICAMWNIWTVLLWWFASRLHRQRQNKGHDENAWAAEQGDHYETHS